MKEKEKIEARRGVLSPEDQKHLALMAQDGDEDAHLKLEASILRPLSGYIKGRIAGSAVLKPEAAESFAGMAFENGLRRYKPDWKESFSSFLKKTADTIIQDNLALMAQGGDDRAFGELYLWLDKSLSSYICRKTRKDFDHARDLAWESWTRFKRAEELKLPKFDPKGEQSFFQYLKNKADTVIDHHDKGVPESGFGKPDEDKDPPNIFDIVSPIRGGQIAGTVRLELLRLIFLCCAKPHQLLALGFIKLLEWRPREVVNELSDWPLGQLSDKFCTDYYSCVAYFLDLEVFLHSHCSGLSEKASGSVREVYAEHEYEFLRGLAYTNVSEIPLKIFYGPVPSKSLNDWCDKVRRRAGKAVENPIICRNKKP